MLHKKIVNSIVMLAICSLIAKILGAFYRIPLVNVLGGEGIGIYHMIFPIYTFLLVIISGGITIAVANIVAQKLYDDKVFLFVSFQYVLIISSIISIVLVLMSSYIAQFQSNIECKIAYIAIAPSLIFVSLIAVFRGFFQGKQNLFPLGISQLFEQAIKLLVGLYLARRLATRGILYAVAGALIGISVSEFVTFLFVILYFFTHYKDKEIIKKRFIAKRIKDRLLSNEFSSELLPYKIKKNIKLEIINKLYKLSLPVTISALVLPLLHLIDSIFIIRILANKIGNADARVQYGLFYGPVCTIINLPSVITMAFSVLNLPTIIRRIKEKEDYDEIINSSLKLNFVFSLVCCLSIIIFSEPLLVLLYGRGLSINEINISKILLRLSCPSIVFVALIQVITSDLQAIAKSYKALSALLISGVFRLVFTYSFIRVFNIYVLCLASLLFCGLNAVIDVYFLRKYFKITCINYILKSIIIIFVAMLLMLMIYTTLYAPFGSILSMLTSGFVCFSLMFFCFYKSNMLDELFV